MKSILNQYTLGSLVLIYTTDSHGQVGFTMIPKGFESSLCTKEDMIEPLVQIHIRGDVSGGAYVNGHSMTGSQTTASFRYVSQEQTYSKIITTLADSKGRTLYHYVTYDPRWEAVVLSAELVNLSDESLTLEAFSSFCIYGLSPFSPDDAPGTLVRHYIQSAWSAEGRMISDPIERMNLEPSWSSHGVRIEKIGQVGSLPVRGHFPFAAVEDIKQHVTWAAQIACNSTWQIELKRKDASLAMMGGLGDYDYGHWAKLLSPGESFRTPEAFVTVASGNVDDACRQLLTIQKTRNTMQPAELPLLFNEYCTTWGIPSDDNITKIIERLKGRGYDYLIMDCGWYIDGVHLWYQMNGDWNVSKELFPQGLKAVVDKIHAAGMKAGIWFEMESAGSATELYQKKDWMLHKNGYPILVGGKSFLDLRKPEVNSYLDEKVIGLLRNCEFDYIKVDYNDSIGIGCDGAESLGEGLRQNMNASARFFQRIHEELPHVMIENCSSGGHRLEPVMMQCSSMASFSDAHECAEIPIIAANLHRTVLPGQSQIWAVIRAEDSLKRISYSLTAAMLGVMCLSGNIYDISECQQAMIDRGTAFYKKVSPVIRSGNSEIIRDGIESYRHPQGWQAVKRLSQTGDQMLVVIHGFKNEKPLQIPVPVGTHWSIADIYTDASVSVNLEDQILNITMTEDLAGAAVLLQKK